MVETWSSEPQHAVVVLKDGETAASLRLRGWVSPHWTTFQQPFSPVPQNVGFPREEASWH